MCTVVQRSALKAVSLERMSGERNSPYVVSTLGNQLTKAGLTSLLAEATRSQVEEVNLAGCPAKYINLS